MTNHQRVASCFCEGPCNSCTSARVSRGRQVLRVSPPMCYPCWTPCDCCEACQEKNRKLISCCGGDEDRKLKRPATPYVTRNALAAMKQGGAGTDNLSITDDMLMWTPAEARRYFESVGQEKPDPDVVARRSPDDTAPPPVRTGAARGEQELLYGLFCPCCDTIICEAMEHRARKKARAAATSNGAVGLEMQR